MPNDVFGRPVSVGDMVTVKGTVESVTEDPNYVNCTVLLVEQMPPSGAEVRIQVNTAQLEDQTSAQPEPKAPKPAFEPKPAQHEKHESSKK